MSDGFLSVSATLLLTADIPSHTPRNQNSRLHAQLTQSHALAIFGE